MHPKLTLFMLDLPTWRVVVLGGVLLCWALFLLRARRLGYPVYPILGLVVFGLPVGVIGAHLFNWLIPKIAGEAGSGYSMAGQTIIGSIVLCLIYGYLFIRYVLKTPPLPLLDALAFTYPLSTMVGRFGCLMDGCCYGRVAPEWAAGTPLALFTMPASAYLPPSQAWSYYGGAAALVLWDFPLMLMLHALLILIIIELLYRNRERLKLVPGTLIALAVFLDASGRLLIEFARQEPGVVALVNPWQKALVVLWAASALWLAFAIYKRSATLRIPKGRVEP